MGVLRAHGPAVALLGPGGEADGHPGGISLRGHHQGEGGGELLAVADAVGEEGLQRVLARRGVHGEGVRELAAEVVLVGDGGVEGVVGAGLVGDVHGEVLGDLRDLLAGDVAGVEGLLEHGGVHAAQLVGGGVLRRGQHGVVQPAQIGTHPAQGDLPAGRLQLQVPGDVRLVRRDAADPLRRGQAVTGEVQHMELGAQQARVVPGGRIGAVGGVGVRADPHRGASALLGRVAEGLAVEAVQGAQAQV